MLDFPRKSIIIFFNSSLSEKIIDISWSGVVTLIYVSLCIEFHSCASLDHIEGKCVTNFPTLHIHDLS